MTTSRSINDIATETGSNGHRRLSILVRVEPGLYTVVQSNSIFVRWQSDAKIPRPSGETTKPIVRLLEHA